ncbi:Zn(II)2Cys6 transcription factor [Aspergillus lucknowensis]|uniref:Zn(2)-C6 fungal-type domain-containing protein n=1 Tax=Aspergillus lucknowensis TaxID=176173 RepID=A0ABR4LNM2_9EURO
MVRTTIACARCRSSKVKCIHDGAPPCRGCVRAGKTEPGLCILSRPEVKKSGSQSLRAPRQSYRSRGDGTREAVAAPPASPPSPRQTRSPSDVLQTATLFMHKFPELGFLHKPTFSRDLKKARGSPAQSGAELLGAALTALCSPLTQSQRIQPGDQISLSEPPHLYAVQCLLVKSMVEWGQGNVHLAWMYSGAAIRMMQFLNTAAAKSPSDGLMLEIHNRTLWSCFIMDRLVFSGVHQPLCLPLDSLGTHWPVSEADYAFGHAGVMHYPVSEPFPMTMNNSYAILVQGFDLWTQAHHWVVSGGRRRKDMLLEANHPWKETSLWMKMRSQLQGWREAQDPRLLYPTNPASICASLGKGEIFGYINLIYYVSILFLNREYIPFLPKTAATPSGPVDPPLLPASSPEGWWETRAQELFGAASYITNILADLSDEGAALDTPFAAFCNFSAATMNVYVSCFPSMNLDRSSDMAGILEKNLAYLDRIRGIWPIGQGWWTTIERTRALYGRHSRDPHKYCGKTRDDFISLEASMHDVTGASPTTLAEQEQERSQDTIESTVDELNAPVESPSHALDAFPPHPFQL